jgi:hypothetical protein
MAKTPEKYELMILQGFWGSKYHVFLTLPSDRGSVGGVPSAAVLKNGTFFQKTVFYFKVAIKIRSRSTRETFLRTY